jgi:glutamine cyclotransferase
LIVSDGSHKLSIYALPTATTKSLVKIKEITVLYREEPVMHINELEFVNGYIYANIWYKDVILKIDATTGEYTTLLHSEYVF